MRVLRLCLAAAFAAGLAAPAFADGATQTQSTANSAPATGAKPALDPNQTVCKHIDTLGSRIPGPKVCRTRQQWADLAAEGEQGVDAAQANGNYIPPMRGK